MSTAPKLNSKGYVERIQLGVDLDKRVALASVRIGEVLIHGVAVWRGRGRLRVYFPSYKAGYRWEEAIELPHELRSEVEADVIAAYKEANSQAKKAEKQKLSTPSVASVQTIKGGLQ